MADSWCPGASKPNWTQTQSSALYKPKPQPRCKLAVFIVSVDLGARNHQTSLCTPDTNAHRYKSLQECWDIFTSEGDYMLRMFMWQFFEKEHEAVQIRHVARNRLPTLFWRPHYFNVSLCQTSRCSVCLGFWSLLLSPLAAGCMSLSACFWISLRGKICEWKAAEIRLWGKFCKVIHCYTLLLLPQAWPFSFLPFPAPFSSLLNLCQV